MGLISAGMIRRALRSARPSVWGVYRIATLGLIISPIFVAVGITYWPVLESVAAMVLAICMITLVVLCLIYVVPVIHGIELRAF